MPEQKSILIGIPCLDTIKTETVSALFSAINHIDDPAILHIHKSSLVHDSRNKIVQQALEREATHVIFIDSDVAFEPEAIKKLLAHDEDIVGGLYYRKQRPHTPTIMQKNGDKLIIPTTFPRSKMFEVFSIGTGFLMVKTKVFKDIKTKPFGFGLFKGREMGEDVYFCRKAKDKGYKIWCDPTIRLAHVGEYLYDERDYDLYKDKNNDPEAEDAWGQL